MHRICPDMTSYHGASYLHILWPAMTSSYLPHTQCSGSGIFQCVLLVQALKMYEVREQVLDSDEWDLRHNYHHHPKRDVAGSFCDTGSNPSIQHVLWPFTGASSESTIWRQSHHRTDQGAAWFQWSSFELRQLRCVAKNGTSQTTDRWKGPDRYVYHIYHMIW